MLVLRRPLGHCIGRLSLPVAVLQRAGNAAHAGQLLQRMIAFIDPPCVCSKRRPPAGHFSMQSVLTRLCFAKSFAASRGKPNIRPPTRGVELGQWRPSAFCSPRRPARRLGRLHGCGACRPQTPWGCAPCGLPATGPGCWPTRRKSAKVRLCRCSLSPLPGSVCRVA